MRGTDPIRLSDYHHRRVVAITPNDAARQFKLSAILAGAIIMATIAVAVGTLAAPSYQAQVPPVLVQPQAS